MRELYNDGLPEVLEQLPTPKLDDMLRAELNKEQPDEQLVRRILKLLRQREADFPVEMNEKIGAAWHTYQKKTDPDKTTVLTPFVKAAAILLICGLLALTLPRRAQAETFFQRLTAWTESVFELFSHSEGEETPKEYRFRTDHPGLQTLYDAVADLGIDFPVVPMWLDEEYELDYCNKFASPTNAKVVAAFLYDDQEAVLEINIYYDGIPREFYKNEAEAGQYEFNGVIHYIFRNRESWMVVWIRENIECSMYITCQEDVLYRILDSIYTMEE